MYTIYVKPTNKCNLNCQHCFNYNELSNNDIMSDDVLVKTISWINKFVQHHPKDIINCQLHGGEPCLYDVRKLKELVKSTTQDRVNWSVTTNLVYKITSDLIDLFWLMHPFGDDRAFIQTSWDYSIRFANDNQQKLWENNVRELISRGIEVQPTVCLSSFLVSKDPKDLFDYMMSLGVSRINFERLTKNGRAAVNNIIPTNKELDQWLLNAFILTKNNYSTLTIPLFESVEYSLNGCMLGCRARKCMSTVYTINPNGSIGGCPNTAHYAPNCVKSNALVRNALSDQEKQHHLNCLICEYFSFCNGDCFQLQHDDTGCPGMKSIYKYLMEK